MPSWWYNVWRSLGMVSCDKYSVVIVFLTVYMAIKFPCIVFVKIATGYVMQSVLIMHCVYMYVVTCRIDSYWPIQNGIVLATLKVKFSIEA